jgi:hypothetical protein
MSGMKVKSAVEHLSRILSRYESGDLDRYGYDEIAGTIVSLESFQSMHSADNDLFMLCGLASSIVAHLYVARGYATPNIPRDIQYYQNMNNVRRIIQQIKRIR